MAPDQNPKQTGKGRLWAPPLFSPFAVPYGDPHLNLKLPQILKNPISGQSVSQNTGFSRAWQTIFRLNPIRRDGFI